MESMPLVSVPVITYNSSKYVLETLESIKAQTYQNIELIVSDDGSTDNTVEICREWIEKNKDRFVRTELLTTPENTGISANLNRAEAACRGEWVKSIAGDDLLMQECIEAFYDYVCSHADAIYVFSKMKVFGDDENQSSGLEILFDDRIDRFNTMTVEEQLDEVLKGNVPPAPTSFYNRKKSIELGIHCDERIRDIEDWPKWINILSKGVLFRFIDKRLVEYRLGGISTPKKWPSASFFKSRRQVFFYYIFGGQYEKSPESVLNDIIEYEYSMYVNYTKIRKNIFFRVLNRVLHIV